MERGEEKLLISMTHEAKDLLNLMINTDFLKLLIKNSFCVKYPKA